MVKKKIISLLLAILMLGSSVAYAADEPVSEEQTIAIEKVCDVVITEVVNVSEAIEATDSGSDLSAEVTSSEETYNMPSSEESDEAVYLTEESSANDTPLNIVNEEESENSADNISEEAGNSLVTPDEPLSDSKYDSSTADEVQEDAITEDVPSEQSQKQVCSKEVTGDGNGTPASDAVGNQSGKTVIIKSWEYDSSENSSYHYLKFNFTSEATAEDESPAEYCAYIAGVNITHADNTSLVNDDTYLNKLLVDIADSFYAGKPIMLFDRDGTINGITYNFVTDYNIKVDSIDAEKIYDGNTSGNDSFLCWAATASNMLEYADWSSQLIYTEGKTQVFADEDAVFDYYQTSWTNVGSTAEKGSKWFLNGINLSQSVGSDGNVIYNDTSASSAQTVNSTSGGYFKSSAAENNIMKYEIRDFSASALSDAADGLADGNAAGLGIYTVSEDGSFGGGHAVTLFGYIKDLAQKGIDALKAIFITDSDTNSETLSDRSSVPNTVEMYTLSPYTYKNNNQTVYTVSMDNYVPDKTYVIDDVTVLNKYTASEQDTGTKNAVSTVDYVPNNVKVVDTRWNQIYSANVGESVGLAIDIDNYSYDNARNYNEIYADGTFTIKLNGKVIDEVQTWVKLDNNNAKEIFNPLGTVSLRSNYTFSESGTYEILYNLKGFYYLDENGNHQRIEEAYYGNNSCRSISVFQVNDNRGSDTPAVPGAAAVSVYSGTFNRSRSFFKTFYYLTIKESIDRINEIVLNGEPIDPDVWSVKENSDGTVTITFDADFLRHIFPGTYDMQIFNSAGDLVAVLRIELI